MTGARRTRSRLALGPLRRAAVVVSLLAAIATALPSFARADAAPDSVPMPPKSGISYSYDAFHQSVARPVARSLDPSRLVRKVTGNHREAANVDQQDRVYLPSTWWQPRVGFKPVSVAAMKSGPGPGTGPAPGPWKVTHTKTEGVSKGFEIKDSNGDRFAIKFDPPAEPELATGADVVVSRLFWAAGYNVPDNTIATFRREDLEIGKDATGSIAGHDVPLTESYLDGLLKGIPQEADGRYRVIASRYLKGKPLGEWRFSGQRSGDAEDQVPHELRRELRGLWTISAWLNHTDCSARNTLDMYVKDGGRSFVRHCLLDFSGCLGSASIDQQPLRAGHEYFVDYRKMAQSAVTLALPTYEWERIVDPNLRGVGRFDAATFDAGQWQPYLPNPAFDDRTDRDTRWGARIVASFPDELIRAAVEMGEFSDPRAAEYLVRILEERRDKIAARWLTPEETEKARGTSVVTDELISPTETSNHRDSDDPGRDGVSSHSIFVVSDATSADSAAAPDTTSLEAASSPEIVAAPAAPIELKSRPGLGARAGRAARNVLSDGWVIVKGPFQARGTRLLLLGLALGTEAVIYANDQEILDAIVRNRDEPALRSVVNVGQVVEPVGFMGRTNPVYIAALGLGYATRWEPLRVLPTEILESHLLAGGIRNVGKILVGRKHPYDQKGPYEFDFGNGTSFPSGHTSVYYELATIASMHAHSLPVTIAAYSLATAGAIQRVESLNHWPSDVFAAAVYGTFVARTVVRLHQQRTLERPVGVMIGPWLSPEGQVAGLQLSRRF